MPVINKTETKETVFGWELGSDPIKDGWLCVLSAHLYYEGEPTLISDAEFDLLKEHCMKNWDKLDPDVQEIYMSPNDARSTTFYVNLNRIQLWLAEKYVGINKKKKETEDEGDQPVSKFFPASAF